MASIMFVHAHPDDEGTLTAGSMIRAAQEGHTVVVVFATHGEHGSLPEGLAEGTTLAAHRMAEAARAAEIAGVARVHWLGYSDSGMYGWEQNNDPAAFARADLDEAAGRLCALIDAERPDVLVGYDWHGNYGHPDHVRVHQVVRRAHQASEGRVRLFEATMNRDLAREQFRLAREAGVVDAEDFDPDAPMADGNPIGTPEADLQLQVDVSAQLATRRAMMECHASQTDVQGMLSMPAEAFAMMFAFEHYIEVGNQDAMRRGWFF